MHEVSYLVIDANAVNRRIIGKNLDNFIRPFVPLGPLSSHKSRFVMLSNENVVSKMVIPSVTVRIHACQICGLATSNGGLRTGPQFNQAIGVSTVVLPKAIQLFGNTTVRLRSPQLMSTGLQTRYHFERRSLKGFVLGRIMHPC